ncbi:molybdopterin-dependent oxidoreductase [Orrella marina]|uniref:Asp-tRNA(Asn)/Glu-tRNA(Gln) amidotransferase GatCAB subunit C n=1 Tax=Orrella marina TaxID=2163011 RepID=A0A2R4XKB2_9BURK|nr:molybdopterin-dependent oxidoreductase [Orrella marina]AWB34226.1 Asp-tRNA(Asn)/Glu-tRNA(Gln) amidotransferase GatCAB subunit C [Orrella marina]
MARFTSTHWGVYEVLGDADDPVLGPFRRDPDPSPIGLSMLEASTRLRVEQPCVRKSWIEQGIGASPHLRGVDPFVQVDWDYALDLAAQALSRTISQHGKQAIFGGSYGWSSAGRFHHAQSQIHRFLNAAGGYVRHVDSYSLGAARVLMPHIVAPMDDLMARHTSWDVMSEHTELFVAFGGVPAKNAQVNPGGASEHLVSGGLANMARAGVRFVNISPMRANLETGKAFEWIKIRPNTDTAMMLGLAFCIHAAGRHDKDFLQRYCTGFERFETYLLGNQDGQPKDPRWASAICGVPATVIEDLATRMANSRTMINVSWAIQRAHRGEQPYWMVVTLAAMLGQIGLPGGGFGVGYGAMNMMGMANPKFGGPTLPQGQSNVREFIPVARITDLLEKPGESFQYNGSTHTYPKIELIYWAGGNPFHHHQDLRRLIGAWKKVPSVLVNEQFWTPNAKLADIVFPATTTLERDDIGFSSVDRYMIAMRKVIEPCGQARDDFDIFRALARRLGCEQIFTEGRDASQWIRFLYEDSIVRAKAANVTLPSFETFWEQGLVDLAKPGQYNIMLEDFRKDPDVNRLNTPSGKLEIFSERIASFGYEDCPGHAVWLEPVEWLGSETARRWPLHLVSDQPKAKLHSQLDHSKLSQATKLNGRERLEINPVDAIARGLETGDTVWVMNERGKCLATAVVTDELAESVVKLSTGAWFDPDNWMSVEYDKHGNPNILTPDIGSSQLSQGCSAHTCLVDVQKFEGEPPDVTAYRLPDIIRQAMVAPG